MGFLDISRVTVALMEVLENAFLGIAVNRRPDVFPEPPALLEPPVEGVGLYMYHIVEDPHYKNLPAAGGGTQPPIRYTPMGLKLYYHLSARDGSPTTPQQIALNEQLWMGYAVKALRDNPEINIPSILPAEGNNRLRITLNPISPSEAVSFWTAGNSSIKLSTYYEVSVALLEPEQVETRAGRVLNYGLYTFVEGAPRINSSQNVISYNLPGTLTPQTIRLQPAQVPMGSVFVLEGTGFSGNTVELLLINQNWSHPALADSGNWLIQNSATSLTATAFTTADPINGAAAVPILPGVYGAQIRVNRQQTSPDGSLNNFEHLSNQCPIVISPRIDTISLADPQGRLTVTGYLFAATDLELRVYIANNQYSEGTFNALNEREYAVNPGDATELQIRIPIALVNVQDMPLRIFVNGIESPPAWIPIP